jgi:hypothetical protein
MQQRLFFFLALILIWGSELSALPSHVVIIRHAETTTDTVQLSVKGKERSAAYMPYFLETPELAKLGSPAAIFASAHSKTAPASQRSIDTVKVLADKLQLTVFDKFESSDYKRLVEELKANPSFTGKMVLITWDHETIPELARALGAYQTPAQWHATSYDRTWIITLPPTGRATFQNLPQRLMFGDSSS